MSLLSVSLRSLRKLQPVALRSYPLARLDNGARYPNAHVWFHMIEKRESLAPGQWQWTKEERSRTNNLSASPTTPLADPAAFPCLAANTGQSGLGKSTMINTIFASHLVDTKGRFEADEPIRQTTEIQAVSHGEAALSHSALLAPHRDGGIELTVIFLTVVQENNVRLRLNIVDTPGYGDLVNNENWCAFLLPF